MLSIASCQANERAHWLPLAATWGRSNPECPRLSGRGGSCARTARRVSVSAAAPLTILQAGGRAVAMKSSSSRTRRGPAVDVLGQRASQCRVIWEGLPRWGVCVVEWEVFRQPDRRGLPSLRFQGFAYPRQAPALGLPLHSLCSLRSRTAALSSEGLL